VVGSVPATYTTLTFTRRPVAEDVSYIVESTSDFVNWSPDGSVLASLRTNADGSETVVYRSAQPFNGGKQFLRVQATLTP
jgi:hypothetical protein